ncbi:GntR family transcriptional regulator [Prauserella rugosa]|uniref:GntR family transcriptional regulator n=1 Tax=Prauserella rugosa TaxID=43354 RepID=A0A660C711_9PSEU|nr:GntR family transcriptional regulator [Prauserella rugosa]KMS92653.1 hypothetical protein ACZ91_03030 [Streptomyces regensis]TWH15946.1 GntR family transcriptional regulator [Prauserella rugosa]TWH16010.1 GntR family transcriptional regulator [Prauserella rugosa]
MTTTAADVAHHLREAIKRGDLVPGQRLGSNAELVAQYGAGKNTVSKAIGLLKAEGLLAGTTSAGIHVRTPPPRTVRSNTRYAQEKKLVRAPLEERRCFGSAEADTDVSVDDLDEDSAHYDVVAADEQVAAALRVDEGSSVLRRRYSRRYHATGGLRPSTSYLPVNLISDNPELFDAGHEPWPGGTMHQLYTVGIEVAYIEDRVTAVMPSPETQTEQDIPPGVPVLQIEKISFTGDDVPVEVTYIPLSAENTTLIYRTDLPGWTE